MAAAVHAHGCPPRPLGSLAGCLPGISRGADMQRSENARGCSGLAAASGRAAEGQGPGNACQGLTAKAAAPARREVCSGSLRQVRRKHERRRRDLLGPDRAPRSIARRWCSGHPAGGAGPCSGGRGGQGAAKRRPAGRGKECSPPVLNRPERGPGLGRMAAVFRGCAAGHTNGGRAEHNQRAGANRLVDPLGGHAAASLLIAVAMSLSAGRRRFASRPSGRCRPARRAGGGHGIPAANRLGRRRRGTLSASEAGKQPAAGEREGPGRPPAASGMLSPGSRTAPNQQPGTKSSRRPVDKPLVKCSSHGFLPHRFKKAFDCSFSRKKQLFFIPWRTSRTVAC